jgi:hypothetical protein
MPRRARLDAPGTLHHVIVRGIEGRRMVNDIWRNLKEGYDFFKKNGYIPPNDEAMKKKL